MNCPYCGIPVTCSTCGATIDEGAKGGVLLPDDSSSGKISPGDPAPPPSSERTFLIVARGHSDLLDQLAEIVGDLGWVRLMEDRRTPETILPRAAHKGAVHVARDIYS